MTWLAPDILRDRMDLATAWKRIDAYERLIRLDKPIGTLLLLWPTLWALWIASDGRPSFDLLLIFAVGTLLMRSAGCAMNDWADRDFDGRVKRTRDRPLAAGEIAPAEALAVGAVLAALAFGLVLFLNRFALLLSFVALAIACLYPFAKRVFPLPQIFLGIAFAFGVPMAFAAIAGALPAQCWLLFAAGILYGFGYDTEYAMVDRDDDLAVGIHTSAITLGRFDVAAVLASYAGMVALLAWLGAARGFAWPYWAGLGAAAALLAWHYPMIRGRSREGCFRAFRHASWAGLAVFAGIVLAYPL
jgi:4-hydroxybenzoate polyprenyltransferase